MKECPSCAMSVPLAEPECPYCHYEYPTQKPSRILMAIVMALLLAWPAFEGLKWLARLLG